MVVVLHALFGKNSGYSTHWRGVWVKVYTNNRALLLSRPPVENFLDASINTFRIYEYDGGAA